MFAVLHSEAVAIFNSGTYTKLQTLFSCKLHPPIITESIVVDNELRQPPIMEELQEVFIILLLLPDIIVLCLDIQTQLHEPLRIEESQDELSKLDLPESIVESRLACIMFFSPETIVERYEQRLISLHIPVIIDEYTAFEYASPILLYLPPKIALKSDSHTEFVAPPTITESRENATLLHSPTTSVLHVELNLNKSLEVKPAPSPKIISPLPAETFNPGP
jgi:hypothetical protein